MTAKAKDQWKNNPKLTAEKAKVLEDAGCNNDVVEQCKAKLGLNVLQILAALEQYGPVAMQVIQYLITQIQTTTPPTPVTPTV